jgi:hypothetical protein
MKGVQLLAVLLVVVLVAGTMAPSVPTTVVDGDNRA